MEIEKWFRDMLESFKDDFDFRLETIILDLTEKISKRMKEKNINRIKLAELLKVSPPAVTKILNGSSNFTLKSLLSLADALELDLKMDFKEKGVIASPKIQIPVESGFTFFKEKSGDFIPTSITIVSGPTVGIVPDASTSVISPSPSPSPSPETERWGLAMGVNA